VGNLIGRNMESSTDSTDKKESTKRTDEWIRRPEPDPI
jgi:hypothetical protein